MEMINERVEHIKFGPGVITDVNDDKIVIQFRDEIGTKIFAYPEAFGKFIKAMNVTIQDKLMEECHRKEEKVELERERIEKEREKQREEAESEEKKAKMELAKKKAAARSRKMKSQN